MVRDAVALLDDMLAQVVFLEEATDNHDLEDILDDDLLERALEHALMVLGEAAKAVPDPARARHPELPWSEMARTRDFLIHSYHRTDPQSVWKTAIAHAVPLRPLLEKALEAEKRR